MRAVVQEADSGGIPRMAARIHDGNDRSAGLLKSLGFVETGVREVEIRPGENRTCRFFLRNSL